MKGTVRGCLSVRSSGAQVKMPSVARRPKPDALGADLGLALEEVETVGEVADLVERINDFPHCAGANRDLAAAVRRRHVAHRREPRFAAPPSAIVEGEHDEPGLGEPRGVGGVEMLLESAPSVGEQDRWELTAARRGLVRHPQIAGERRTLVPDPGNRRLSPYLGLFQEERLQSAPGQGASRLEETLKPRAIARPTESVGPFGWKEGEAISGALRGESACRNHRNTRRWRRSRAPADRAPPVLACHLGERS